ncbi:MAG TPA: hypothetical protein VG364_01870 [Candidatus Dormibacteraeota bacterium]|nr:hypothetical protein [Candidatus Dormibacteraeota bacterium]
MDEDWARRGVTAGELESEFSGSGLPRVVRGVALIGVSMIAVLGVTIQYLDPHMVPSLHHTPIGAAPGASYRISAIDFVDPSTGWVVADYDSGGYAILHTDDGGATWTRQLSGVDAGRAHYLKFFDAAVGVSGLIGTTARLDRTIDGGQTWMSLPVPDAKGSVLSWSFIDAYYGWVLISGTSVEFPLPAYLYRTDDGGRTWQDLGVPASSPDQVFEAGFTYFTTGWLSSANDGPYAYKTGDFGETWTRVPLPAPPGGWPTGGTFLVAVQPTSDGGVTATVVFFPTLQGRKGQGAKIRDFPPLTVRAFDGGRPVTYSYATPAGSGVTTSVPQALPPNQTQLTSFNNGATWSTTSVPSTGGALGYLDSADWWWVGPGREAVTADGGETWSTTAGVDVQAPLPGSIRILDRLHAWLIGTYGSRAVLEATADGGRHWRVVSLPGPPAAGQL